MQYLHLGTSYINTTALSKVTNTIDRLYSRINNPTPIVKFGMMKLADQFFKNCYI